MSMSYGATAMRCTSTRMSRHEQTQASIRPSQFASMQVFAFATGRSFVRLHRKFSKCCASGTSRVQICSCCWKQAWQSCSSPSSKADPCLHTWVMKTAAHGESRGCVSSWTMMNTVRIERTHWVGWLCVETLSCATQGVLIYKGFWTLWIGETKSNSPLA